MKNHERLKIDDGKHLIVKEHIVTSDAPLHWHSYFELEIILSGLGKYVINDKEYDILHNNVFLLTTTDFHYIKVDETTRLINISFDEELIDEKLLTTLVFAQTEKGYALPNDEIERLKNAAMLLKHECSANGDCERELLHYILSCLFRKNTNRNISAIHNGHYQGIKKAIVYMEMHFKEKITLQMIATEAGYHPAYFSELFKNLTGETYTSFLRKLRIGYARTLLANGFSVTDACFLSGFTSLSNFGTIFKKNCMMSPYEYAKSFRK